MLKAMQQDNFSLHLAAAKIKTGSNVLDAVRQDGFSLHLAATTELGTNHTLLKGSGSALICTLLPPPSSRPTATC